MFNHIIIEDEVDHSVGDNLFTGTWYCSVDKTVYMVEEFIVIIAINTPQYVYMIYIWHRHVDIDCILIQGQIISVGHGVQWRRYVNIITNLIKIRC